jgi:hypothetical protein
MPEALPNKDQAEEDYYENYRKGLIKRHLCKNGRLLQWVLLVEQDSQQLAPDPTFQRIRRHSLERIDPTGADYEYSAYPVVVCDPHLDDKRWYPDSEYVVGGGDNPLLAGGLAMATFALEDLLGVSDYSFDYACLLLDFFLDSEIMDATGERSGFPLRRRQWWHSPKEVSKDELCGFLLGMHFFMKAAKHRGAGDQVTRAFDYLVRLGKYLKKWDYGPAGAWVFQFPFTRIFKFDAGSSRASGHTFPDDWGPFGMGDEFLTLLATWYSFFSLDFDFNYTPRDLYRDGLEWLPELYAGATAIDGLPVVDVDTKFFNVMMYLHALLMIVDNPVHADIKSDFWGAFEKLFAYFCAVGGSPGQGDARLNAYFGVVADAYGRDINMPFERERPTGMYEILRHPKDVWFYDLPLCGLPPSGDFTDVSTAEPFRAEMAPDGSTAKRYGEAFTWEQPDQYGHTLDWRWAKTMREIGPTEAHAHLLVDGVVQGKYYNADLSRGYRVEAAGLDLLFPTMLAAYFDLIPAPTVKDDSPFDVLPLDGPPARGGYLANIHHKEVHSYLDHVRACQIQKIPSNHRRWFKDLGDARVAGFDPCAKCLSGSQH